MTCIQCGCTHGDPDSHGYCRECGLAILIPKIRARQLSEGYSDCFARGYTNCSEINCKYREVCFE